MKWLILAALFNVQLNPYAVFTGKTINTEGQIVYWDVWYEGYDSSGNLHRIRESIELRSPPYTKDVALALAMEELVKKIENEDEQVIGFMKALESGQNYELTY